jgi:Transposase DDE domain
MSRPTASPTTLQDLVALAVPLCQQAQRAAPRNGPGRPPTIPDWLLAVLIFIAVLCRKKTKSAQYRYLLEHRADWAVWLDDDRFPARSTYFDRYRRAHRLFQAAIRLQGQQAIADGLADAEIVAVDKSLLQGLGPPWHKQDRQKGETPAGVDTDSTWGYSSHHGWVQGYSYEVVVTATAAGVVWPLLASVDTASVSEAATFAEKIPDLPRQAKYVDADSGYDVDAYQKAIEEQQQGRPTGRRFLCPENPRHGTGQRPGPAEKRRRRRRALLASGRGRKIYRRRSQTVEPFHEWLARAFELEQVWHRGLENNRTQVLAAIFAYQVLLRYNHQQGSSNGQIKAIVDRL